MLGATGALAALAACRNGPRTGDVGAARAGTGPSPSGSAVGGGPGTMPTRELGRTGERVSILGLGGSHIGGQRDEAESIRIVRAAIDGGVTFLDNSWDYHGGQSEVRMGKALRDGYRRRVFLMTKVDGRTREAAASQLEQSLERLGTDVIDLVQVHEVIRMNDPDRVFAEGGAIEALQAAKAAGKVRYLGFTGHKSPDIHLHMLELAAAHGFHFDAVLMPLNVMDAHFESFQHRVLPVAAAQGIGIMSMKPFGGGAILRANVASPVECLHYAMSLPTSVVITGCDSMEVLHQALDAAYGFRPMSPEVQAELLAQTSEAAKDGRFERFKTSQQFDTTAKHPEWLG